jgi:hypothetical protein
MCHKTTDSKSIVIPLTHYDIEEVFDKLKNGDEDEINWSFYTEEKAEQVRVKFIFVEEGYYD